MLMSARETIISDTVPIYPIRHAFARRISGFTISACESRDFDFFRFETGKRDKLVKEFDARRRGQVLLLACGS